LISKLVSPHLIKIDEAEQNQLVAAVDQATGELMRKILHDQDFKSLESAWRGLFLLVRRVETDVDLKIYIAPLSHPELVNNLKTVNSLADSILYRWLVRDALETQGGEPWSLICGNYDFNLDVDDAATLIRVAKLAEAADAPFISYIKPSMFGIDSFAPNMELEHFKFSVATNEGKLWSTIRALPESKYLGLVPMRFLSRLPYGEAFDATESFSFEEFTDYSDFQNYLWTNPSFIVAVLLAKTYRQHGWNMGGALERDLENLPLLVYRESGSTKTIPCAEIVLTETVSDLLIEQGLMPLLSFRDSDRVRLARFQSVADPLSSLNGRWND
jgi:type VI secretion system protein ImpC